MKGDIGHIVSRCSHVEYRGKILPIEKDGMQSVSSVVDDMLQEGMKVIAIARKNVGRQREITPADEFNMTLVAICPSLMRPSKPQKNPWQPSRG